MNDLHELTNIEAEQALLGALMTNNNAFVHLQHVQEGHFYEPLHARLFAAMSQAWQAGKSFSPITLRAQFAADPALLEFDGGAYLVRMASLAASVVRVVDYAHIIIDLSQRRHLVALCDEARQRLLDPESGAPLEAVTEMLRRVEAGAGDYSADMFQDDVEVTDSILRYLASDVQPYSTGWAGLDLAMDGGLYPGKSYGFAARKKMGKTILAGSLSCNLNLAGIKHLFICGEMSPEEIQRRTLARLMHVEQRQFRGKDAKLPAFHKKIAMAAGVSRRSIFYRNAPGLTFDELKRYILLARLQKRITGVILDYWQLVGGKPKHKSDAAHLDEVAQWIANTCRQYGLWSVVTAQINQEGNTRGGEGIRMAFDQVYTLNAPGNDPARSERWLEMADTRYTEWRSVGAENNPGFFLNKRGPYLSERYDDGLSESLPL